MKEHWDQRYNSEAYVYGTEPNLHFKAFIDKLRPGKILLPGEGEGRNAVYAASKGWEVTAMDQSHQACRKALLLAERNDLTIDYHVSDILAFDPPMKDFDVVSLVFVHLPPDIRQKIHRQLIQMLKPGGLFHMVAFSPEQLQYQSGGPKDLALLYDEDILRSDLQPLQDLQCVEIDGYFEEGAFHHGRYQAIEVIGIR